MRGGSLVERVPTGVTGVDMLAILVSEMSAPRGLPIMGEGERVVGIGG